MFTNARFKACFQTQLAMSEYFVINFGHTSTVPAFWQRVNFCTAVWINVKKRSLEDNHGRQLVPD